MTLYARSDLIQVTIPRGQGGCGDKHTRPVVNGAPDKVWSLDCAPCETSIRAESSIKDQVHPLWSGTISGIPETPDEEAHRKDEEKRGQQDAAVVNRSALESLSTLPQVLQQMTALLAAGQLPAVGRSLAENVVTCPDGHANLRGTKFCGECGGRLGVQALIPATIQAPVVTESYTRGATATVNYGTAPIDIADTSTVVVTKSLNDKPLAVLREIAKAAGLPTRRSKAEQIAVIEGRES